MVVKKNLRRRKVSYYRCSAALDSRFLQDYKLLVAVIVILLDDKENAYPATSHTVDGSQSVGMYDYEQRDDHEVDNSHDNDDLHFFVLYFR